MVLGCDSIYMSDFHHVYTCCRFYDCPRSIVHYLDYRMHYLEPFRNLPKRLHSLPKTVWRGGDSNLCGVPFRDPDYGKLRSHLAPHPARALHTSESTTTTTDAPCHSQTHNCATARQDRPNIFNLPLLERNANTNTSRTFLTTIILLNAIRKTKARKQQKRSSQTRSRKV